MGKYSPLGDFLRKQKTKLVPLTFAEIEQIIGSKLPNSQRYPAWWSNNPWNNVMTQVWLDAGFETEQVDVEKRRLVFRRTGKKPVPATDDDRVAARRPAISRRHPMFGALKGTVRVGLGVDLTEPADPEWGDHAWSGRPWTESK